MREAHRIDCDGPSTALTGETRARPVTNAALKPAAATAATV